MENLELALLLMVVGMATVFAILLIVIYFGKGLILFVNKYAPEEIPAKRQSPAGKRQRDSAIPETEAAAIVSAVNVITKGFGKVIKIEKL